jgi:hypothetical protein
MSRQSVLAVVCAAALAVGLLAACGGGGGGASSETPAVTIHTLWHANGQKASEGPGYLVNGEVVRHGEWTDWFDNAVIWKTGVYVEGNKTSPWVEYNRDTSVRVHWTDH